VRKALADWEWGERLLAGGPIALWLLAFLVWGVVTMIRQKRLFSRGAFARSLGAWWGITFVAAVAWLLGWAMWLSSQDPEGHRPRWLAPQEQPKP
jgi:hypothetical protein